MLATLLALAIPIGLATTVWMLVRGIKLPPPGWYLRLRRWHWPLALPLPLCIAYVLAAGMTAGAYAIADVALHHQGWWEQVSRRVLPTFAEMMTICVVAILAMECAWLLGVRQLGEPPWSTTSQPTRTSQQ